MVSRTFLFGGTWSGRQALITLGSPPRLLVAARRRSGVGAGWCRTPGVCAPHLCGMSADNRTVDNESGLEPLLDVSELVECLDGRSPRCPTAPWWLALLGAHVVEALYFEDVCQFHPTVDAVGTPAGR